MISASCGEVMACLVRVPTEVTKQRVQAGLYRTSWESFKTTLRKDGVRGFYAGYGTTIMREVPFALIQFPIYEMLKSMWAKHNNVAYVGAHQAALCGALAGGIGAAATTPIDVAKTRLMLQQTGERSGLATIMTIYRTEGAAALFKGVQPRVLWISIGGAVFLGAYEAARRRLSALLDGDGDGGGPAS